MAKRVRRNWPKTDPQPVAKKRNQVDATLRNVRAGKRRLEELEVRVDKLERAVFAGAKDGDTVIWGTKK